MKTSIRLVTIPLSVLLAMRNISDKGGRKKIKTHILRSINFFFPENRAFCGEMWQKNCRAGQVTCENKAHAACLHGN